MDNQDFQNLPEGVQRVAAALKAKNHPHVPVMLDDAARTAQQAADEAAVEQATLLAVDGEAEPVVRNPFEV